MARLRRIIQEGDIVTKPAPFECRPVRVLEVEGAAMRLHDVETGEIFRYPRAPSPWHLLLERRGLKWTADKAFEVC